jgi:hypothetical protein
MNHFSVNIKKKIVKAKLLIGYYSSNLLFSLYIHFLRLLKVGFSLKYLEYWWLIPKTVLSIFDYYHYLWSVGILLL